MEADPEAVSRFMERPGCGRWSCGAIQNRNVRSGRSEAKILQALALMNSSVIDQSTAPGRGQHTGSGPGRSFFRHGRPDRNAVPRDAQPAPDAAESQQLVKYVEAGGTHSKSKPKIGNVFQQMITTDKAKTRGDKGVALGDVFWALLNSTRVFNQPLIVIPAIMPATRREVLLWCSRREWMRVAAGVSFCSVSGWIERGCGRYAKTPHAEAIVHPAVDAGRTEPARHVRPEARARQWRTV